MSVINLLFSWFVRPGRKHRLTVAGRKRTYFVRPPRGYDGSAPMPVVLALHGATMNAPLMAYFCGLSAKADEAGFIAVYPDGTGRRQSHFWNAGNCCGPAVQEGVDDVAFIRAVLDELAGAYRVDERRVFVAGLSNGAMLAYRLASELSDRIAAIAAVAGTMATETCAPARPVPVLHFHGTEDEFVPYGGGRGRKSVSGVEHRSVDHTIRAWVKANGCAEPPTVEELPDRARDGTRVTRNTYGGGTGGAEVVLVTVEGGGHTWPGRDPGTSMLGRSTRNVSATDLVWEFFRKHPMQ